MTAFQFFFYIIQAFSKRERKANCAAFCTNRLEVLQGMSVEIFAQKLKDVTYPCSTFSRLDATLKPSNLKEIAYFTRCCNTKIQMSTPLWRNGPWNFAHVFYMSIPRPGLRFFFVFVVFHPQCLVWGGPHFPKKLNWRKIRQKKKKRQVRSLQRHIQDEWKISRSEPKNRRVDIRREVNFGVLT